MKDTCVLVHSRDEYHETALECIYRLYSTGFCHNFDTFVTTEEICMYKRYVNNIQTGKGLWSTRLRSALRHISYLYKNVILILEDLFITNRSSFNTIQKVIDFHNIANADITKFGNHPFFTTVYTGIDIDGFKVSKQYPLSYMISHQPISLWNIGVLEKTVSEDVTPWEHECRINDNLESILNRSPKIYCVGEVPAKIVETGYDYGEIIEFHHALSKGNRIEYKGKYKW